MNLTQPIPVTTLNKPEDASVFIVSGESFVLRAFRISHWASPMSVSVSVRTRFQLSLLLFIFGLKFFFARMMLLVEEWKVLLIFL